MHTKIASDGENLFVPIPAEILSQAGFESDQLLEITVSENTIFLRAAAKEPSDPPWKSLVALVHAEALELFEGDTGAKNRWMALPQASLGGRKPFEMLRSEKDIEAVRVLIGRLEHGSIP